MHLYVYTVYRLYTYKQSAKIGFYKKILRKRNDQLGEHETNVKLEREKQKKKKCSVWRLLEFRNCRLLWNHDRAGRSTKVTTFAAVARAKSTKKKRASNHIQYVASKRNVIMNDKVPAAIIFI